MGRVRSKNKEQKKVPPTVLIILDGFGLAAPDDPGNAITPDTAPAFFRYREEYPSASLVAHGKDVGLFPDQEGNSEAGHFNIGAGRIVEQDLVHVQRAIDDGTFFKNEAFHQALYHVQKYKTSVHLMGLLTNGQSAHAHPEHLYALLEYFREKEFGNVYLHLFTDGRDSGPHAAVSYLQKLRSFMKNGERIASVTGRFYGMDRNKMWERTERAYNAMVLGEGKTATSAEEAIAQAYNRGETDEYIQPTVIVRDGEPVATITDNDAIFFFNCRSDRARQITKAFVQHEEFQAHNPEAFKRKVQPQNIRFVAMTDFGPDLEGIFTAFPSPDVNNGLVLAIEEQRDQLYISETEKYAHVTYFINGGYAQPVNGEKRELVASTGEYSYADKPEMRCKQVTDKVVNYLKKGQYDYIVVNYPNADMLGHTGNLAAAQKGILAMDKQVERLVEEVLERGGQVMITADHGNAEEMYNQTTGEIMTEHTTNPVPCVMIGADYKGVQLKDGRLADVAPTLLKMMDISKPPDMTGKALF